MKIAILEFDTRLNNDNINKMLTINEKYCKLHNYSFIFDNIKIDEIHYDFEELRLDENIFNIKLYFHRFEMFEKYINEFDYLVSFDSDVCVNNPNIKIEDFIDENHHMFLCQDSGLLVPTLHLFKSVDNIKSFFKENNINYLSNPLNQLSNIQVFNQGSIMHFLKTICSNPNGLNAGFIIIRCSDIIKEFIADFKKYYILFSDCFYDQGCIGLLLQTLKYKNIVKILNHMIQGNPFLGSPFNYDEENNFLCHFYGNNSNTFEMQKILNKIENNKWWSQIK